MPPVARAIAGHEATLEDPANVAGDKFGTSVAIDGQTMVVGNIKRGDYSVSSVSIFSKGDGGWALEADFEVFQVATFASFGASFFGGDVAIDGDVVVVGASGEDLGMDWAGAVYVFERTPAGWAQMAKLASPEPAVRASFGLEVAIDGDVLVVGDRGSAAIDQPPQLYVFRRSASSWVHEATLAEPDAAARPSFPHEIDMDGGTIVVAAPIQGSPLTVPSHVYVFEEVNGAWSPTQTLTASSGEDDQFGYGAAISGDRIVVGQPAWEPGGLDAAVVFERTANGWVEQARILAPPGTEPHDRFGVDVALDGDLVAVRRQPVAFYYTGAVPPVQPAVHMFRLDGAHVVDSGRLTYPDDGYAWRSFGADLDISGDRIVVGAPWSGLPTLVNPAPLTAGATYVYRVCPPAVPAMTVSLPIDACQALG